MTCLEEFSLDMLHDFLSDERMMGFKRTGKMCTISPTMQHASLLYVPVSDSNEMKVIGMIRGPGHIGGRWQEQGRSKLGPFFYPLL